MGIVAEISDKMPSMVSMLGGWLVAGMVSAALALVHRAGAWFTLLVTLLVGGFFAWAAYQDAFVDGPLMDSIQGELGLSWVIVSMVAPLLPLLAVLLVLFFPAGSDGGRRDFPLD